MTRRIHSYAPAEDLRPFVAGYQFAELDAPAQPLPETLATVPHYSFIFHFGDGYTGHGGTPADNRAYPRNLLAALRERPIVVQATGRTWAFRVAMRPHTFETVLGADACAMLNQVIDLAELREIGCDRLLEQVADADDDMQRIAVFERWLRPRVAGRETRQLRAVARAIDRLAADGELRIRDLAAELAIGERQLERCFLRHVGMRPKYFQRVLRVHGVLQEIGGGAYADWAALASQFGFADQSHLVREFATFAGETPVTWLQRKAALRDVFHAAFSARSGAACDARRATIQELSADGLRDTSAVRRARASSSRAA